MSDTAESRPRARRRPRVTQAQLVNMRLDSVRRAFTSDAAIAKALGVDPAQVTRWRQGQTPDEENADRLAALDVVIEMLSGVLSESRIPKWLQGANANLADRTPLGMLRMGDLPAVIAAVRVLKSGAYA